MWQEIESTKCKAFKSSHIRKISVCIHKSVKSLSQFIFAICIICLQVKSSCFSGVDTNTTKRPRTVSNLAKKRLWQKKNLVINRNFSLEIHHFYTMKFSKPNVIRFKQIHFIWRNPIQESLPNRAYLPILNVNFVK